MRNKRKSRKRGVAGVDCGGSYGDDEEDGSDDDADGGDDSDDGDGDNDNDDVGTLISITTLTPKINNNNDNNNDNNDNNGGIFEAGDELYGFATFTTHHQQFNQGDSLSHSRTH